MGRAASPSGLINQNSVVKEHMPTDSRHHCAYMPSEDDYARRLRLTIRRVSPSSSVIVARHRPPFPVSSVFIEFLTEAVQANSIEPFRQAIQDSRRGTTGQTHLNFNNYWDRNTRAGDESGGKCTYSPRRSPTCCRQDWSRELKILQRTFPSDRTGRTSEVRSRWTGTPERSTTEVWSTVVRVAANYRPMGKV